MKGRMLTVKELRIFLASFDDDAIVCEGDRSYGTCLHDPSGALTGYVKLNDRGEGMEWSNMPKEEYVKAILL